MQTAPLASSLNASFLSRVYSMKSQSLCAGSAPRSLRMMAMSPMKSFPGRIPSLTMTVPFGKRPFAPISFEAYTFFVDQVRSESRGGSGASFSFVHAL